MKKRVVPILLILLLLVACQSSKITTGVLEVKDAWARPAPTGDNGAVYLVIENGTAQDDVLLSARSEVASAIELHMSEMDGDHMSMNHKDEITLPAGEATKFSPGGLHIMLVGLTQDLKLGDTFDVTLNFQNTGEKVVTIVVKDDANDD